MKKLSIIIPTRNRLGYLKETLSILSNFDEDIEVIVVDNLSEKHVRGTICNLCKSYNFTFIMNNSIGAPKARNVGYLESKTDHVWFLDDDDIPNANAIGRILEILEVRKEYYKDNCMTLPSILVMSEGTVMKKYAHKVYNMEIISKKAQPFNTSCVVIPRCVIDRVNGWDENLVAGQDTDLFLRIANTGAEFSVEKTDPIKINISQRSRISFDFKRQMKAKMQFLKKNHSLIRIDRKMYYIFSFIFMEPLYRRLREKFRAWLQFNSWGVE